MQKLSKSDIQKIQGYFASQKDVVAVYLYGSFAHGNPHKGSDLDIAVLFDGKVNLYERLGRLYSESPKLSIKAEPEVRNVDLNQSPIYLSEVIAGVLIYSSDEVKRVQFEVGVMNTLRDTEYLRNLRHKYLQESFKEGTYGHKILSH